MARHVWSLLCEKAVLEAGTQALHIQNVYEEIHVQGMVPSDVPIPDKPSVLLALTIVSVWERSNLSVEEDKESFRVRIIDPNGKELGTNEQVFSMTGTHTRTRAILRIPGMPISVSGRYIFEVEGKRGGKKWIIEAMLPLTVNISITQQSKAGQPS
jgi:hypothetical protein